jgi:hypothetical protein
VGGLRRQVKRLREKVHGAPSSFPLVDGTSYTWNPETHGFEKFLDAMKNGECDYEQRPRPEPHPLYHALCRARYRRAAVLAHFPYYGSSRPGLCPYDLTVIIREGRLEPVSLCAGYDVVEEAS